LLSDQLVVVQASPRSEDVPAITGAGILAHRGVARLSLADPETQLSGRSARAWLEKEGLWAQLESRVIRASDGREALKAVESRSAQAGVVFATEARFSYKARVALRVPLADAPPVRYSVAVLTCSADPERAQAFVDFLQGVQARMLFERHGLLVESAARSGVDVVDY
jgi:molybdate transport system substrate-binding protein